MESAHVLGRRRTVGSASRGLGLLLVLCSLGACGPDEWSPRQGPEVHASYDADGRARGDWAPPAARTNLVVIVIDTLREDVARRHMPSLTALASRGVRFADASAPAPWTKSSMASLLTGLLPHEHGGMDSRHPPQFPASLTTFAEILSRTYGYDTAAFVDSLPGWFGGRHAMLQGFDAAIGDYSLQATASLVDSWARARDRRRPFFLLLHTMDVHEPYGAANHPWPRPRTPPAPAGAPARPLSPVEATRAFFLDRTARELPGTPALARSVVRYINGLAEGGLDPALTQELRDAYEDGVAWADGLLASTLEQLRELGLLHDTLLVVTSDHGEAFGEHGHIGHGRLLYDEVLRIPLVMQGPAPFEGGRVVHGSASLLDVLPTFFDLAGIPPPGEIAGRSLLPRVRGEPEDRPVISEEVLSADNTGRDMEGLRVGVRSTAWKYVLTYDRMAGTMEEELYDLRADPGETVNLVVRGTGTEEPDPAFCRAARQAREPVLRAVEADAQRTGTPYGASVATVVDFRVGVCDGEDAP